MPALMTPTLTITIDRRRMIADCTVVSSIQRFVDGSDQPFSPQHRIAATLENHDAVRLKLLYTFDDRIYRTDLNRGDIGVRIHDTIAASLLNEDRMSRDEIVARLTLFDANNVVLHNATSPVVRIDAT
ncbi:MAG: hypothetical protein ACT4P9_17945 [Betaproteobacteria bacterium]